MKRDMTTDERARVRRLAYASKRGERLMPDEMRFLRLMFEMDPDGYRATSGDAAAESVSDWLGEMGVGRK
jgi:hypothetical protein